MRLVENGVSYAVEFYLPDIVRSYRERFGKVPTVEYLATVRQMKKVKKEPDIVRIVNESVMPRLEELGLAQELQRRTPTKASFSQQERGARFTYREGP